MKIFNSLYDIANYIKSEKYFLKMMFGYGDKKQFKNRKELEETVRKIEVFVPLPPPEKIEKKKKIKKIIYESDNSDEESEEVIIKKKKAPKQPSYSQLADMSVEQQIKNKLQQEKITCFFNQLTGKKFYRLIIL